MYRQQISILSALIITWIAHLGGPHAALGQDQYPSLHAAARAGDVQAVTVLLDQGADINLKDGMGLTPLAAAAAAGRVQVMQLLLDRGADLQLPDNAGNTPLHTATAYGQPEAVRFLVEKGASRQALNYAGLTPLDIARNAHRPDIIAILEPSMGQPEQPGTPETVPQDPNQLWRQASLIALADPNRIIAELGRYPDLYQEVNSLFVAARNEIRAWIQPTRTRQTTLIRALQSQLKSELGLIARVAHHQGATRTTADANQLIALWDQRLKGVTERLREQRRQELAQLRGRRLAVRPMPSLPALPALVPAQVKTEPHRPQDQSYFAPARTQSDTASLAESWVMATQDVQQLATDVNDLLIRDLGYLRTVAIQEKASPKVIATIDAIILARAQRHAAIVQSLVPAQEMIPPGGMRQYP